MEKLLKLGIFGIAAFLLSVVTESIAFLLSFTFWPQVILLFIVFGMAFLALIFHFRVRYRYRAAFRPEDRLMVKPPVQSGPQVVTGRDITHERLSGTSTTTAPQPPPESSKRKNK